MDIITRNDVAALALSYEGVSSVVDKERYVDLIATNETQQMKNDMMGMSSCALVVRGLWRKLGLYHAILESPYKIGRAMSDLVFIARERAAWHTPSDAYTPDVGDHVIIGSPGNEHVYTIVSIDGEDDEQVLTSIDGGQGPKGAGILLCSRKLELRNDNKLYDVRTDTRVTRPVIAFIDITSLGIPGLDKKVQ